ncbi:MAG: beta-lactamase family protein, partial [Ignavibacteriales bacterium]|nr:beta-lactamase family protein [Ignavibacteriales bacterium]
MKRLRFIFLFLTIMALEINAQLPNFINDSLDFYIERGMKNWEIPGAAVLIVKDGKVVFQKGYGVTELGKQNKVDENTLFMIGSNTKAFTGTALALLELEQKLKLDDKVIKYLPDFKMKDKWVNDELNLQDIVSHRIGMETFQGDFIYWTS